MKGLNDKIIRGYIDYFENFDCRSERAVERSDNGSYIYDDKLLKFEKSMDDIGLLDHNYLFDLSVYGETCSGIKNAVEHSGRIFASAVLTYYIRQERFCPGMLFYAAKEGIFLACLKKLYKMSVAV